MPGVTELLTEYDHLALFERELLQLLSVIYEPAHTALIVSCLRTLDIKGPRGNRPTTPLVNHHISKLQQSGFLTESRQCRPNLVEILTRSAVQEGSFTHYAAAVQKEAPSSYYYGKWSTRCWRAMRELRIGIYRQDFELIDQSLSFLDNQCRDLVSAEPPVVEIVTTPFQPDWLDTLPPSFQFFLLNHIVRHAQRTLSSYPEIIAYLESETHFAQIGNDERLPFQRLLLNQYLLQGETLKAEQLLEQNADIGLATGSAASLAFMRGDRARAAGQFDDDLAKLMAMNNSETVAFFGPQGVFHVLSQIGRAEQAGFERAARQISIALSLFEQSDEQDAYTLLHRVIECRTSLSGAHHEIVLDETNPPSALTLLIAAHAQFWLSGSLEPEIEQAVLALYQRAAENGYRFFTVCLGRLLAQSPIGDAPVRKYSAKLAAETGLQPIADLLEPEEPWKRSLQALINISTSAVQPYRDENTRLVWLITDRKGTVSAQPREQKRLADGHWSRGRPISLARLYGNTKLPYLSLQDRKICLALEKHDGGDGQPQFDFNREKLLLSLIGHPLLFLNESPTTPVEFISSEPELLVEDFGEHLHINFSIPIDEANTILVRDTPTRFKVIRINDNHRRIARITGCSGLTVPVAASEEVLTAIGNISSFMTVHSAIAVDRGSPTGQDITFVEADSTIYMHILPYGSGFRLEMFVKPFEDGSHYLKPGQGVENIMAEVDGKRLQTRRDLARKNVRPGKSKNSARSSIWPSTWNRTTTGSGICTTRKTACRR